MMQSELAIFCENLSKNFRIYQKKPGLWGSIQTLWKREFIEKAAVKPLNLEIRSGEIIGLLGPNGAGKTTLMKMFTGIVIPTAGQLRVLGFEPAKRDLQFRKKIALVMGQKSQLWWDIPAMDSLQLLMRYYEIPEKLFQERVGYLAKLLEVESQLQVHVRKLSLGERMKLELMACLLHDPQIVFLDEPTIGLDLIAQRKIREFLLNYHREKNITLILTSHYMADVTALCQRIVLVMNGEKHFDGSIRAFEGLMGQEKYVKFFFSEPQNENHPLLSPLHPQFGNHGLEVELRVPEDKLKEVCAHILKELPVTDFQTEKMPVERVMQELMSRTGA